MSEIELAAGRLRQRLFGPGYPLPSPGSVGFGVAEIHAYMSAEAGRWYGETPREWEGFPVIYHWGAGPTVAAASVGVEEHRP